MTVYALLVGIDAYPDRPLSGAVADVDAAREFLDRRAPGAQVRELHDGSATRRAVVDGFRTHLASAGPGDVALFWFSGHGRRARVPDLHRWVEPDGWLQTLVCADSGHLRADGTATPDLLDKELSLLLAEVAARGPHVVVVLDSCRSGGATRDLPCSGVVTRSLEPVAPAPPGVYLPGLDGYLPPPGDTHVLLAAARAYEKAAELPIGGAVRGVFSHALLGALASAGTTATYRELLAMAHSRMLGFGLPQHPVLMPDHAGPADQPFLGGAVTAPAPFRLRLGAVDWEVDAGRCHGLPEPTADAPPLFTVAGRPDQVLRVDAVDAVSCRVTPLGWDPEFDEVHPVVLAAVPVPPFDVVVGGDPDDDPAAVARVRAALRSAGPGGAPSPDVRAAAPGDPITGPRLWITAPVLDGRPVLRVLRADGTPAAPDVAGHGPTSAAQAVAVVEHVARWEMLLRLDNPLSRLAGAVRLEIVAVDPDGPDDPADGEPPLRPGDDGAVHLAYRWADGRWKPPHVVVRLRNDAPDPLWCTLVDLTDRYKAHTGLFPCARVAAGGVAAARQGEALEVTLPRGRPVAPGASVRDWLKLIVTEEPAGGLAFELPALGEPVTRGGGDPRSVAARLRRGAPTRDVGAQDEGMAGGDWASVVLPLVTTVPG